jgi:hypothetical protein
LIWKVAISGITSTSPEDLIIIVLNLEGVSADLFAQLAKIINPKITTSFLI